MATGVQAKVEGKAIALFSDGTGNSSAKLFKTNVWRMYEAVDLGPSPDKPDQVAFYDNGVGTSSLKPLAMLGGIFGFGLKRNVLRIYRFACRNYHAGDDATEADRIYAFGFSRGAFTIRLVVGLIASQGLVRYTTERELHQRSADAFRAFNHRNNPNFFPYFAIAGRFIRSGWIRLMRLGRAVPPAPPPHRPGIEFVGVWDTVAAYGGPLAEITRGIDNWIWPLSMSDYKLHPKVKRACHALALDDMRDSFHPLLWDEFHESLRAEQADRRGALARRGAERRAAAGDDAGATRFAAHAARYDRRAEFWRTRIQQLWFAGMHADVGGGYPDESLSYVSLYWMIEEAERSGLRLLTAARSRIETMRNDFGPLHNSRAGLGAYYRYQPRKITAYMHPKSASDDRTGRKQARIMRETLGMRDPTIGEQEYRPQGMLLSCKVHESVVARITAGTDDYGPITLPDGFDMHPSAPRARPAAGTVRYDWQRWQNIRALGTAPEPASLSPLADHQEAIWDNVLVRRFTYFAALLATLALLSSPLWLKGGADAEGLSPGLVTFAQLPQKSFPVLTPWIDVLVAHPWWFLALSAAAVAMLLLGSNQDAAITDRSRDLWCQAMNGAVPMQNPDTPFRRLRNSYLYQSGLQLLKWRLLPNVIGLALVALIIAGLYFAVGSLASWIGRLAA